MKALLMVSVLSSVPWIGCGGGHAAGDGGGGAGGSGGTTSNDAGADRPCGAPAQTYTFATQRVATLASDRHAFAITLRADGTPLFYYWGGPTGQQQEVWAVGLPDGDDAGVSVSVGYQLSRGPANAGIFNRSGRTRDPDGRGSRRLFPLRQREPGAALHRVERRLQRATGRNGDHFGPASCSCLPGVRPGSAGSARRRLPPRHRCRAGDECGLRVAVRERVARDGRRRHGRTRAIEGGVDL